MPDRDAEIVAGIERWFDAFNRGDYDAAIAMTHPDIEYVGAAGLPPVRGAAALRAWMEPDAFESQQIEALECTVAGDKVLIRQRTRARGAGSGIEMENETWGVCTVDDELRAVRLEIFQLDQEAAARRAAGLAD